MMNVIEQMVQLTYPIEKKERYCATYKSRMDAKREALRKRLNDTAGKGTDSQRECESQPQISTGALS